MKQAVAAITLLMMLLIPAVAKADLGIGYQLGSQEGVSIGVNRWDIGVAVDQFEVSLDRRFTTREFPNMYFGLGGQVSDNSNAPIGVRGKVGLSARAGIVELFGEATPTVMFGDAGDFDMNYALGLRIWF
ncbi:hypothetical protein [Ferrimonas pelagia]|uniref:Outer membrane protein beta-barrel domain-containing protein n=1 Tax=Ferrimonas pelagia TaxID=1177826 RepID=A0ABP9EZ77_9GAMM